MKNLPEPVISESEEGQEILPRVRDAWNSGGDNHVDGVKLEMITKLSNFILTAMVIEQKCTVLELPVHDLQITEFLFFPDPV